MNGDTMKLSGLIAIGAAALLLTGCTTMAAPQVAAPPVTQEVSGEELLYDYLTQEVGNSPEVARNQINIAEQYCSLADDFGARDAALMVFEVSLDYPQETQDLTAEAVGAGAAALCPQHSDWG
jgi:hypothetical protein